MESVIQSAIGMQLMPVAIIQTNSLPEQLNPKHQELLSG